MTSMDSIDKVKPHTRQKHVFLEAYLGIWTENVGRKSGSVPTLEIYDLYSSYGICRCDESGEEWNGSAMIAATCLMNYGNPKFLWLNSYNPESTKIPEQHEALKKNLNSLGFPDTIPLEISGKDVASVIGETIKNLDERYPSIWILDPYSPSELPWDIVETIANTSHTYKNSNGSSFTRRPELFINLMTSTLARYSGFSDGRESMLDVALGMPKSEWKPLLEEYSEKGIDAQSAIIEIYGSKLEEIYGKPPIAIKILGTEGNVVYTVFLVTKHNAGHYMMKFKGLKQYQDWLEHDWTPKAKELKAKRSVKRKIKQPGVEQSWLDNFTPDLEHE